MNTIEKIIVSIIALAMLINLALQSSQYPNIPIIKHVINVLFILSALAENYILKTLFELKEDKDTYDTE